MRFLSSILFVALLMAAMTASAASFGPELPLTPASPNGSGQELPYLSMPQNGTVLLWNGGATYAGRIDGREPIPPERALALDPVPHRDGGVVSIGNESMAAWVENDWLYVRRIGSDGSAVADNFLLQSVDSRHTMRMAIGASKSSYLVVWQQWNRVLSTMLDTQGQAITWQVLEASGPFPNAVDKVAVASNGTEFLVVWELTSDEPWVTPCSLGCPSTNREVHAIIVGADGMARPETETVLATSAGMPDVVWNGSNYLVVWATLPKGGIAGRQIAPGLASVGPVQTFTTGSDFGPAIVWDGSSDILAFAQAGATPQELGSLRAIQIESDGSVTPLSPTPVYPAVLPRQYALAAAGSRVALAYTNSGRISVRYLTSRPTRRRSVDH